MFVEVALPYYVHQTFTYALPERFTNIRRGARVLVPLGNRLVVGYAVAMHANLSEAGVEGEGIEIRNIEEVFDTEPIISEDLLELSKWIADYYYAPWGEVIRASLPTGINAEPETMLSITDTGREFVTAASARTRLSLKFEVLDHLVRNGPVSSRDFARIHGSQRITATQRQLADSGLVTITRFLRGPSTKTKHENAVRLAQEGPSPGIKTLSAKQSRVLDELRSAPSEELSQIELQRSAAVSLSVINTLEKRGFIKVFDRPVRRDPLRHIMVSNDNELVLTPKQQSVLDEIELGLETKQHNVFLLHGVTGSGKTEVYIRAMQIAVSRGQSALMLVPEISLTPVFSRRLRAQFGDSIAILHSSLSDGERYDEWLRLRSGESRVCIGARSGVFAPLKDVGLIVVDEEHESSYKQDETPRYHGRDTAIMRAMKCGATVILGSATPSMESFHNAHSGKYRYLRLDERIGGRQLASVEIIDMREVFKRVGKTQVFSDEMSEAISANHKRGEQTMVLLNRRGYSPSVICRSCGNAARCPNCDVALTFHRHQSRLMCHYCAHEAGVPKKCPVCDGAYIHFLGEGTEKIEAMLSEMYPEMRIARLDRDTTRRRGAFEQILGSFAAGELDLLVGTQMIAKGHDYPNVTLVCVVSVDGGLSLPDFRAAERTFQLLTQVAGRAGRGDKGGRVLIQSYHPDHYALQYAREQNYEKFYEREITFRRGMHYPPLVALINVVVHHQEYSRAGELAAEVARLLREADAERRLRVLGPALAPLAKLRGEHRFQILIKTTNRRVAREALDRVMMSLREDGQVPRELTIEVDPVNLM